MSEPPGSPDDTPKPRGRGRGSSPRPRVAVCDEGELSDVHDLLCEIDGVPLRLRPEDLGDLRDWERPSRLFVTSVRIALARGLPLADAPEKSVSIAVADSDTHLQCTAMLRRGFRYVVRRPVHPEALRLLLMQVLWRGPEHRVVARFPFGGEVRWRSGLRRGRCTLVEISAHGCRLLTRDSFGLGDRVHLRVPAALTGSRDLRLRGRIVRRDRWPRDGAPDPQLALQFEGLSRRSVAHLDALLAEHASGPVASSAARGGAPTRSARRDAVRPVRIGEAERSAPEPPEVDRRRRRRSAWPHEVLALEPDSDRVLHTLIGSDLSAGGVRVEPHPLLRIGDRLRLALYDARQPEPLVLRARVAHEDRRRGVGLVFLDVGERQRVALEAMLAEQPPLSSLPTPDAEPKPMVLGEIVELRTEPALSGARVEEDPRKPEDDHRAADHDDEEA